MRFIIGLLFACHGAQKMLGMFGGQGVAEGKMMVAGVIELGGLLLAIGLLTRLFAFLGSGLMAVAYFTAHASGQAIKHVPPSIVISLKSGFDFVHEAQASATAIFSLTVNDTPSPVEPQIKAPVIPFAFNI